MARLLAERLEGEGESAGAEVSVRGLLERWVPYGVARGSLELTTKSEYDVLVLEFLADGRLTVLDDPSVAEAAADELETPEPDLDPLEGHADATLRLDLATISGGYRGSEPETATDEGAVPSSIGGGSGEDESGQETSEAPEAVEAWDPTGGVDARPNLDAGNEAGDEPDGPDEPDEPVDIGPGRGEPSGPGESGAGTGADCRSCGEALPTDADVPVRFCPTCGAARPERACPECGTRLRPEWSYCPACGTHASPSGGVQGSGSGDVDAGEWERD